MSIMIRAAARMLPEAIRDRYREQWLADARDAGEVGLRPASIALAALAFAVSYDRPLPSLPRSSAEHRGRLALGLSLAAALLCLSTWVEATLGSTVGGTSANLAYDYLVFAVTALLGLFAIVACITAVVLVSSVSSSVSRVRAAVCLLVLGCAAPLAKSAIDAGRLEGSTLVSPGSLAYVIGAMCVAAALVITRAPMRPGGVRASLAATALALAAATGLAIAMAAWANRVPFFNGAPRNAENQAMWIDWQQLQQSGDDFVSASFVVYTVVAAVSVLGVMLAGRRAPVAAALLGASTVAIALGGLFNILRMMERDVVAEAPTTLLLLLGRVLLVAVVLYAVGGLRLTRVRHRHDVEGAVELL